MVRKERNLPFNNHLVSTNVSPPIQIQGSLSHLAYTHTSNATKPTKAAALGLLAPAAPVKGTGAVAEVVGAGACGWPSVSCVTADIMVVATGAAVETCVSVGAGAWG